VFADRCEKLCIDISFRIDECMDPTMTWDDFGARTRQEYARGCRQDWGSTSNGLTSRELELALGVCGDTRDQLATWSCDEVLALYGPD